MVDQTSPFSFNIRQAFLDDVVRHKKTASIDTDDDDDEHSDCESNNERENEPPDNKQTK